ncbi:hypothetical protein FWF48_03020 [Candidatus Saccharibacteria bacterium]|nr:hypothetical protein [Candidatus Saccharibacteria bacterium]
MFAGTWNLIKLIIRRDRVKLLIWIAVIVLFAAMGPSMMAGTAGDAIAAQKGSGLSFGAVMNFITGPFEQMDLGGLVTIKFFAFLALLMAFFATLFVVRHTRANEEMGATELMLSGRASRFAPLIATLIVGTGAILLMVVLIALGMTASVNTIHGGWAAFAPVADTIRSTATNVGGSWLFALGMGGIGLSFLSIAAIVAQLTETSSAANGLLGVIIGITFVLRGLGDVAVKTVHGVPTASAWSLFSPFGWMQFTHSLTFPNWTPLIAFPVFAIVAIILAFILLAKRDLAAGLLPSRKGHARASHVLLSDLGLTWHLQKNIFLGWLVGNVVLVALIGSMGNQIGSIYSKSSTLSDAVKNIGGSSSNLTTGLLSYMLMFVAMTTMAYAIQSLGKLRAEESSGHLENLLATKTSRIKWLLKTALIPAVGAAVMLTLSGFAIAATASASGVSGINFGQYIFGTLAYWPLVALFMGIYVFCYGILPRAAGAITWIIFAASLFVEEFGALIKGFPQWISNISPLSQLSGMPAKDVNIAAFWIMLTIGIVLFLAGLISWRRRNLTE